MASSSKNSHLLDLPPSPGVLPSQSLPRLLPSLPDLSPEPSSLCKLPSLPRRDPALTLHETDRLKTPKCDLQRHLFPEGHNCLRTSLLGHPTDLPGPAKADAESLPLSPLLQGLARLSAWHHLWLSCLTKSQHVSSPSSTTPSLHPSLSISKSCQLIFRKYLKSATSFHPVTNTLVLT